MTRADLLVSLVKYSLQNDSLRVKKVVESIIAEEYKKQHQILAKNLEEILINSESSKRNQNGFVKSRNLDLMFEVFPQRQISELVLPREVLKVCQNVIEEQHRANLLRSYNVEPRNRILLVGPPGNGKTSLAEAIALSLYVPFYVVNYEAIIGTYLGETANRLKQLFTDIRTQHCVIFFDEFETLGKERGDIHETGEIKRVVSSFLLQIDSLPSHVIVIGATNHSELLDRAVWRRFQVHITLPKPEEENIFQWFEMFEKKYSIDFGPQKDLLKKELVGLSFAEIEEFALSIIRRLILDQPNTEISKIVYDLLPDWKSS